MVKPLRSEQGQTIIEFAFILVLLLGLILFILEFSIIMYDKTMITRASREGARVGSLFRVEADGQTIPWTQRQAEIQAAVNSYLQDKLVTFASPTNATTTSAWIGTPPSQGGTGGRVEVNVQFTYTYLALPRLLYWSGGGPPTLRLSAFTRMRTE